MYTSIGESMAYVRYKLPEPTHKTMRHVCAKLGMKESELSRMAIIEYMRSLGVLSDRVRGPIFLGKIKPKKNPLLSSLKERMHLERKGQ